MADPRPAVYVISFLCALNTRKVVRGRGTDREGGTSNASNTPNTYLMGTGNAGARRVPVNYPPGVGVSTTKVCPLCVLPS